MGDVRTPAGPDHSALPQPTGIKIPEGCVRRVLQELQLMDTDVKRKHARGRALPALPPTPRPLEVLDLSGTFLPRGECGRPETWGGRAVNFLQGRCPRHLLAGPLKDTLLRGSPSPDHPV